MRNLLTAERRNQLAEQLLSKGSLNVKELSKFYQVSTETIRKDLIYLEKEGIAKRSYGGAIPAVRPVTEKPVVEKNERNSSSKNEIALEALKLMPKNSGIILDGGTTNFALAQLLKKESGYTIFTNSVPSLSILSESNNNVFALGGMVRSSSLAIVGDWANQQLLSIQVDVAFIGTDGFKGFSGPTTIVYDETAIKKNILQVAKKSIVLADESKFEETSCFQFANWDDIDTLITNQSAPAEALEEIRHETEVILI